MSYQIGFRLQRIANWAAVEHKLIIKGLRVRIPLGTWNFSLFKSSIQFVLKQLPFRGDPDTLIFGFMQPRVLAVFVKIIIKGPPIKILKTFC